jgi:hypothetical protein
MNRTAFARPDKVNFKPRPFADFDPELGCGGTVIVGFGNVTFEAFTSEEAKVLLKAFKSKEEYSCNPKGVEYGDVQLSPGLFGGLKVGWVGNLEIDFKDADERTFIIAQLGKAIETFEAAEKAMGL